MPLWLLNASDFIVLLSNQGQMVKGSHVAPLFVYFWLYAELQYMSVSDQQDHK